MKSQLCMLSYCISVTHWMTFPSKPYSQLLAIAFSGFPTTVYETTSLLEVIVSSFTFPPQKIDALPPSGTFAQGRSLQELALPQEFSLQSCNAL